MDHFRDNISDSLFSRIYNSPGTEERWIRLERRKSRNNSDDEGRWKSRLRYMSGGTYAPFFFYLGLWRTEGKIYVFRLTANALANRSRTERCTLPVVHLTAAAGPKSLFPEKGERERERERIVVNALVWTLCRDRRLFASYARVIRDVLPRHFARFYFVLPQNVLSDSRLAYETVVDKSTEVESY